MLDMPDSDKREIAMNTNNGTSEPTMERDQVHDENHFYCENYHVWLTPEACQRRKKAEKTKRVTRRDIYYLQLAQVPRPLKKCLKCQQRGNL